MRALLVSSLSLVCLAAQPAAPAKSGGATTPHKPLMMDPKAYKAKAPEVYKAKFTTTQGDIVIEVHRGWAPNGADRFFNLVKGGFWNGSPFYRVKHDFMAQFGFSPSPAVNKAWENATITDDRVLESNKRGFVTFAQTGAPNSRSTHMFINYANNAGLDGQGFAPIGKVIEGMEVADKFYDGYGLNPDQAALGAGGAAYVKKSMPKSDLILSTEIVP